jgi:hypothetical protein
MAILSVGIFSNLIFAGFLTKTSIVSDDVRDFFSANR